MLVFSLATRKLTKDGFEHNCGINHLAHFLSCQAFITVIKKKSTITYNFG